MKKINKNNKLTLLFLIGMFSMFLNTHAQMHVNGALYIGANTTTYLKTGNFTFGTSASIATTKSAPYGLLSIGSGSNISSGSSTQFVDGWVNVMGTGTFLFPIGQRDLTINYYAPILATPVNSSGISAAYFREATTTIGTTLDGSLSSISNLEYWKINGANARLSLTWSGLSNIVTPQLANITIAGYNNSSNKWEAITSLVDATSVLGGVSSTTAGSITSTTNIILANYTAFTVGIKGMNCPELVYTGGAAISWNGTFSAIPTLADVVTINSTGMPGSFVCNSLVLNADITLINTESIEVVNGITGTGKIIMSSESSLVQRANSVPRPTIELTKTTRLMHQYDYVYWGSPIQGDVFSQLSLAKATSATIADAFEMKYKYVSGLNGGWQPLVATATGVGFIARVKAQAPFTSISSTDAIDFKFTGIANNGDITVPIAQNPTNTEGGTSHNLIANPYPSALDADKFLQGNTDVDGVIYLWKQQSPSFESVVAYGQADYIAYTRAGATASSNVSSAAFSGKIASGQGFLVKALGSGPTVTFTNCMRLTTENTNFNKSVVAVPTKDRYKINMVGTNGIFSQIVVAYLPECTLEYDRMYDAGRNSVSTSQLYSLLNSEGKKLAINARPNFVVTDVVPIGISKVGTISESFTLSIQEKEGVFAAVTPVYVHDLVLNTYTDLTISDFTFATNMALLNNRFELVYQNESLSNPEFDNTKAIVFIKNGVLTVSSLLEMKNVEVYDILGRKVIQVSPEGLKSITTIFPYTEGIYIAKITHENGGIATKKLINKN